MEKEVIIENKLSEIAHVVSFIKDLGNSLQLPPIVVMNTSLALEEAIANIIRYSYPNGEQSEIRLKVSISPIEMKLVLIDEGIPFNTMLSEEDTSEKQGLNLYDRLGVQLIYKIMDSVNYQRVDNWNQLTFTKSIDIEIKTEQTLYTNICKVEGVTIVTIEGRLDTINSREFDNLIQPLLTEKNPDIIINCENFSYISSSGIRSLILLQKSVCRNNGSLVMEAMKPEIRKIFDMTGCSSLFTIR